MIDNFFKLSGLLSGSASCNLCQSNAIKREEEVYDLLIFLLLLLFIIIITFLTTKSSSVKIHLKTKPEKKIEKMAAVPLKVPYYVKLTLSMFSNNSVSLTCLNSAEIRKVLSLFSFLSFACSNF